MFEAIWWILLVLIVVAVGFLLASINRYKLSSRSASNLLQYQYELDSGEVVPVKAHHVKSTYHHVNFLDRNNRLIIAVRGTDIKSFWIDE